MNKTLKILVLLYLTACLTACWDKVEINEREYVYAIGYDVFDEKSYEKAQDRDIGEIDSPRMTKKNRFVVTYSAPNLNAIGKNATSEKDRFVLSTVCNNLYEATTLLSSRVNKTLYFNHTKALIFSEDFAKNTEYMKETIDNINRHDQLSRKVFLYVTEGTAKEVLEVENIFEARTGIFLAEIFASKQRTARFYSQPFEDTLININRSGCTLLPRITPGKEELKIAGSAIIKDYTFIGWLGELETRAVLFLKDQVSSEIVDVQMGNTWLPFIITDSKTKKSSQISGDKIIIDVDIQMEGYLQQYKRESESGLIDNNTLELIEKKTEEILKEEIEGTMEKLQKEFKVDVIGIGDYLSKFERDVWDNVKDDWENVFQDVEINVVIDAKLRRIGMAK